MNEYNLNNLGANGGMNTLIVSTEEGQPHKKKKKLKVILFIMIILLVGLVLGYLYREQYFVDSDTSDVILIDDVNSEGNNDNVDNSVEVLDDSEWKEEYKALYDGVSTSKINSDQKNGLYKVGGSSITVDGVSSYGLTSLEKGDSNTQTIVDGGVTVKWTTNDSDNISISSKEYEWIDYVKDFRSNIYLNLTFLDGKIVDWTIVDAKTNKDLGKLTSDELKKLYNFEINNTVKEISYNQVFNLSNLDENTVYKYVLKPDNNIVPKIVNDLDYDVIVYNKRNDGHFFNDVEYNGKVYFSHDSDNGGTRSNPYDETVYMIYKRATKEDIVHILNPIRLSEYNRGEEIDIWSEDYLYNDTNEELSVIFIKESFGKKEEKSREILNSGEIYKKEPFVDYIIIN